MAVRFPGQRSQSRRQFFVNTAESAVGKNRYDIARAHFRGDGFDDLVGVCNQASTAAVVLDIGGELGQLQALIFWNSFRSENAGDDNFVCNREAPCKISL